VDAVVDAVADEVGTAVAMVLPPGTPTSRGNDAATLGNTKKLRCTHQGCPSPQTHDTSACEYHAQLVLDRKRERKKATCAAAFFSALSSNKSDKGSSSSYYSCLSDTDSTNSACLSDIPASTDTSAPPPSSSLWACFATASDTHYVTIDFKKKKSAALDSGALVDITSERHCTGQLTDSHEMVQGISGTTHAWPTRVQWQTKTDCGVRTCYKKKRGSKTSNKFTCQTRPTKSYLSHNLLKQVTCQISGHQHRKAGSLPRARNGSPWF